MGVHAFDPRPECFTCCGSGRGYKTVQEFSGNLALRKVRPRTVKIVIIRVIVARRILHMLVVKFAVIVKIAVLCERLQGLHRSAVC